LFHFGRCFIRLPQITQSLAHIHRLVNYVHLDLKLLSIRITHPGGNGEPLLKFVDFGLSCVRDDLDGYSLPLWKSADCNLFVDAEVYDSSEFIWSMGFFSPGCIWTMPLSVNFSNPFRPNLLAIERIKKKQSTRLIFFVHPTSQQEEYSNLNNCLIKLKYHFKSFSKLCLFYRNQPGS